MDNGMIDPISSMGRAVQSRTSNMSPDQVAQVAKQYQDMGLLSFDNVITLKQQLDRMKQAGQPQPPPRSTVVQDLQQQMGGITSLPSNVGNEKSYARGGIVAFAGGSPGEYIGPYTDEQLRLLGKQAGEESVEAALKGVKDPATSAGKAGKGFFTRPRTIGGISNWKEAGQAVKSGAQYAVKHPGKVAKTTVKGGIAAAAPFMLADAVGLASMDPRYLREAYGSEDPYGHDTSDIARRAGAVLQEQIPFYSVITGEETLYDKAKAAEKADQVKLKGQPWEIEVAQQVTELRRQGRNVEADALSEQYRLMKSKTGGSGELDLSRFFDGAGGGDGGLSGLAASMGIGGNPYAKADGFMGDAIDTMRGMVGVAPDRDAEIAREKQYREAAGIGDANKADITRYEQELGGLPEDKKRDKWLSAAEGFFKMAEAGGESGSTFWGAAGAGGSAGLAAYNKSLDKLEAKEERLRDKMSEVNRYDEQLRMGDIREGTAEYRRLGTERNAAMRDVAKLEAERGKLAAEISLHEMNAKVQIAVSRIQQAGRGQEAERLRNAYIKASMDRSPEGQQAAEEIYQIILKLSSTLPQVQAAEIRSRSNLPGMLMGTEAPAGEQGAWSNFRVSGQ